MSVSLKPINEQVIVLTGATSGIGLSTALMAAQQGAKLVLAARNEDNLKELVSYIELDGGTAAYCVTDVSIKEDLHKLSDFAVRTYGGFDTWINDAGVSIFGRSEQVSDEDNRALFETNFWGLVNGSIIALKHLKQKGGALINLGSIGSDIGIPLQGIYSASKHAIKGFTDALRIELQDEDAPVSVTLIKPSAIATPLVQHAKNYMQDDPKLPPPVYAPEEVAYAICQAAANPVRDVYVGGAGRMMVALQHLAPSLFDKFGPLMMKASQQPKGKVAHDENLYNAGEVSEKRGDNVGMVLPYSAYTRAALHPVASSLVLAGIGLGLALAFRKSDSRQAALYRLKAQRLVGDMHKHADSLQQKAKLQAKPLWARFMKTAEPYVQQAQNVANPYVKQAKDTASRWQR